MKDIRKRVAGILIVSILSLSLQPGCDKTVFAEADTELVYCTNYEVCRPRQIEEFFFNNIRLSYDGEVSTFICDVTNLSEEIASLNGEYDGECAEMIFYKEGEEIVTLAGIASEIKPNETRTIISSVYMDITDADNMAMGIYGREGSREIVKIDNPEFERSRVVDNTILLNGFKLYKKEEGIWKFCVVRTGLVDMSHTYKVTFTFLGEDDRAEKYDINMRLSKDQISEYEFFLPEMSWVKNMDVSFEVIGEKTTLLEEDVIEELIPNDAVKFTEFEMKKQDNWKEWEIQARYTVWDNRYQILQAYYEFLDKDGNVLFTHLEDVFSDQSVGGGVWGATTKTDMEQAVRARVYFTIKPFFEFDPGESPEPEPTEEPTEPPTESPTEEPTQSPTGQPTQKPTEIPQPTQKPTEIPQTTQKPSADPTKQPSGAGEPSPDVSVSPQQVRETVGEISIKIGKNRSGLPVLSMSGRESSGRYEIYRSVKKDSGYKKIAESSSNKYTDQNVKGGRAYYYKVRQVIWSDGKTKMGAFTKGVRIAVPKQNIPQIRVWGKRYSKELSYVEIQLKRYQGNYIQIFYRKPGGDFKNIKLKKNRISKKKKLFRISYQRKLSGLYIKVRTYDVKNGIKHFSDFSKIVKVSKNGKISVTKDDAS